MEITSTPSGETLELRINGRLDAYWANHLDAALADAVRGGARHLRLHMAEVSFLSSAGIRVLLQYWRQLHGINGSFWVTRPSEAVSTVLDLAGFDQLLTTEPDADAPAPAPAAATSRRVERPEAVYELFELSGGPVRCRVIGSPEPLEGCRFGEKDTRALELPEHGVSIGVAALAESFAESRERFGEFLSAGGASAYLPTDGTNVPDYLLATGSLAPKVQMLYGLLCEGRLPLLARFEAGAEGRVRLSQLAATCLELAGTPAAAIVAVAETAGLVGAALRRPPVGAAAAGAPFRHPEVRDWLSFTPDRAHAHGLALVVGVAAREPGPELGALLRPLAGDGGLVGHFHAAAFTYRPLQSGSLELKPTVASLFEAEKLLDVLHLLNDDRPTSGAGESEFVRGACWFGSISD